MRSVVQERLPKFTKEETILIKESFDFLGMNYYTANYAKDNPHVAASKPNFFTDLCATLTSMRLNYSSNSLHFNFWFHLNYNELISLILISWFLWIAAECNGVSIGPKVINLCTIFIPQWILWIVCYVLKSKLILWEFAFLFVILC